MWTFLLACAAAAGDDVKHARPSKHTDDSAADTAPDTAPLVIDAASILAALGDCTQVAGTDTFANNDGGSETVPMCAAPGAVWFTADMDIDCDGGSAKACTADPYYQPETSANDSHGDPLDASTLSFTVLPLDSNGFSLSGQDLHLGTVTAVIYKGQLVWAVLGDRGPKGTVGEGSYALAVALGIDPDPVSGGAEGGVTMVFFTGSDAVVSPIESTAAAQALGEAQAGELID